MNVRGIVAALAALSLGTPQAARRVDLSGVDQFWKVAGQLARDVEPSEAEWAALLATPGYRLALVNLGAAQVRETMSLALKPSRKAQFTTASQGESERAQMLRHVATAWARRDELKAFADSLSRSDVIAQAVALAGEYLPAGATSRGAPPPVSAAVFKDDGFSLPGGIVVDLLNVRDGRQLKENLAHEFHHSYVDRMARALPKGADSAADEPFRSAIYNLRNEGIADQIDKPHPFAPANPGLASYAAQYNTEYTRTPQALARFDTLLRRAAANPGAMSELGMDVQMVFWSNGHPHGAYMAREIRETFGMDSLRVSAFNPARFVRIYAAAEQAHGRENPFSPASWRVIDALETKYWK